MSDNKLIFEMTAPKQSEIIEFCTEHRITPECLHNLVHFAMENVGYNRRARPALERWVEFQRDNQEIEIDLRYKAGEFREAVTFIKHAVEAPRPAFVQQLIDDLSAALP